MADEQANGVAHLKIPWALVTYVVGALAGAASTATIFLASYESPQWVGGAMIACIITTALTVWAGTR